jgi:hypothetical protein
MNFPPFRTPSATDPPIPRACGARRPAASPRPERSSQYLRQRTPADRGYRRGRLLQCILHDLDILLCIDGVAEGSCDTHRWNRVVDVDRSAFSPRAGTGLHPSCFVNRAAANGAEKKQTCAQPVVGERCPRRPAADYISRGEATQGFTAGPSFVPEDGSRSVFGGFEIHR